MVERPDRIRVATPNGQAVEISSASRAAIVGELHRLDTEISWPGLRAFGEAGASGPVNLDTSMGRANVIDAIRNLAERAGGVSHVEPEVVKLWRTLEKELRAEWAAEEASRGRRVQP